MVGQEAQTRRMPILLPASANYSQASASQLKLSLAPKLL